MSGNPWRSTMMWGSRGAALGACLLAAGGCKKHGDPGADDAAVTVAEAGADDAGSAAASTEAAAPAHDADSPDAARDGGRRSRTPEEFLEDAKLQVTRAEAEVKEKKIDCARVVALLDVSFAAAGPTMFAEDRPAFQAFAACAEREQRWRLLRAVANAIIAGDAAQKTTYYLPRALLGLGQYEAAARLSSAALKLWPKEGEAYTTGALASTRLEDWDATKKEADQALLVQRQKGLSDEISAQAHVFKAEALLHLGKIDDSSRELEAVAKRAKGMELDLVARLRERNDAAKSSGLVLEGDLPDEVPLGVYPLFVKSLPVTGGLVNIRLANLSDKPLTVRIEVSLAGVSDGIGKSFTIQKGRPQTLRLTPPLKADFKPKDLHAAQKQDIGYKVSSADGTVLYQQSRSASVLPVDQLPVAMQQHGIDERVVPELAAAWITPAARSVAEIVDAAKKRAGGQFAGAGAETLPQVKALWDELRERGFVFVRDPIIDSEAARAHTTHLPAETIAALGGQALEGTTLFASLLEAIGLDVVLMRTPGHAFVGWMPSKADHATAGAMEDAVKSPVGSAFFLETTMVGSAPADAAVLRGDAELVDAVTRTVLDDGRGSLLRLGALRKAGIVPQAE